MPAATAQPSNPAAVCSAAARLNDLHLPQQVIALISQDSAVGAPLTCQDELLAATRARGLAKKHALDAEAALGSEQWPKADELAQASLALDAENGLATRVAAQVAAHDAALAETIPEKAATRWDETYKHYLKPTGELAAPFLASLIAIFALARVLTLVPWHRLRPLLPWPRSWRRVSLATCSVACALASATLTPAWSALSTELRVGTLMLALVSIVTGSIWLSGQLRIHVEVRNSDGTVSELGAGHFAAVVGELAGEEPRGLEIQRGSDVTAMASTVLAATPEGTIAKLVATLLRILMGSAPWQVELEEVDKDTLAFTVSRNFRPLQASLIQGSALGLDVPLIAASDTQVSPASKDEPNAPAGEKPDLYRVAAAALVVQLSEYHQGFGALGPVTDWRSLGLHYVATTQLDGNREAQRQALARAVGDDPGNLPAQVAYLFCLYREATTKDSLRGYSGALSATLESMENHPDLRNSQVQRRALHSRLAAEINYAYASSKEGPSPDLAELKTASNALQRFYNNSLFKSDTVMEAGTLLATQSDTGYLDVPGNAGKPRLGRPALMLGSLPAAAAMVLWADDHSEDASKLRSEDRSSWLTWLKRAAGPTADYQVGCYYATASQRTDEFTELAARHLTRAATDPRLAAWLRKDPQLAQALREDRFVKEFGQDPRTDFLSLSPLAAFADTFAEMGITTPEEILDYTPEQLANTLGRPEGTATRLLQLAEAATSPELGEPEDTYRVELLHQLIALHLPLPPVSRHKAETHIDWLLTAIGDRLPDADLSKTVVRSWWQGVPPPRPSPPPSPKPKRRPWQGSRSHPRTHRRHRRHRGHRR